VKSISGVGLNEVTSVYGGPQGDLFALLMGQQLHVGGMNSSIDLAERAEIGAGLRGIDLCCGTGGGMRVLVRFRNVASMVGVDATARNVESGQDRCREERLDDRIRLVLADACDCGLPTGRSDFVWGEDAWCYVTDKAKLIGEAARLVRPGGVIAFTDWVEGPVELTEAEAQRFLRTMSFANVQDLEGYVCLLSQNGCEARVAEDTGRFPSHFDLSLKMIEMQLTYDVLATVGFRTDLLETIKDTFRFLRELSRAGKIMQARFIAQRE
jgi:SAM-dependent methyltransferase